MVQLKSKEIFFVSGIFILLETLAPVTTAFLTPSPLSFRVTKTIQFGERRSTFNTHHDFSLFLSSEDNEESTSPVTIDESKPDVGADSSSSISTPASSSMEPESETSNVPIDLPSPLLLGSSMVLGIASTGSVFELSGGNPQYGFIITACIAALGAPLSIFLFYAAIQKGIKETEEDDERYRRGN